MAREKPGQNLACRARSHRLVPGAEQSRNQLQSKVQQLEELPEAPELYVVSREPLGGDLSPLWCTRHFLGQEFTGNSEEGHQAWLHTPC